MLRIHVDLYYVEGRNYIGTWLTRAFYNIYCAYNLYWQINLRCSYAYNVQIHTIIYCERVWKHGSIVLLTVYTLYSLQLMNVWVGNAIKRCETIDTFRLFLYTLLDIFKFWESVIDYHMIRRTWFQLPIYRSITQLRVKRNFRSTNDFDLPS